MEKDKRIIKDAVVQIIEGGSEGWVGCLVQVGEVKTWGIQGWVQIPKSGSAYIRIAWEQMEYIGQAVMTMRDPDGE